MDVNKQPWVWSIAGSDPSGYSGCQADLKTFAQIGVKGATVVTCITAQNKTQFYHLFPLSTEIIIQQIKALWAQALPKVIKIGVLGSLESLADLKALLTEIPAHVIVDPVLGASMGSPFPISKSLDSFKQFIKGIDMFTPNLPEAEQLLDRPIQSWYAIEQAAQAFIDLGVKRVIIKGGHFKGAVCPDFWCDGKKKVWLSAHKIPGAPFRGSGCVFSSALAALWAKGACPLEASVQAKWRLLDQIQRTKPIVSAQNIGKLSQRKHPTSVCQLTRTAPSTAPPLTFLRCPNPIGFYPIVDDLTWLKRCIQCGATTIQLRVKQLSENQLADLIPKAIKIANEANVQLFINDYWRLAIQYGAFGVHLGQTDLKFADSLAIHRAGLRLGISTHTAVEVATALAVHPSYIAIGPVYDTKTKIMPYSPIGISELTRWCKRLPLPVVAIGGISLDRLKEVHLAHPDGIAVLSAFRQAQNSEQCLKSFVKWSHPEASADVHKP